ncbi:MAG TPA: glycosyltransferase family 39 protein, partial [Candidatus Thermoplasmatota archaeon]|nr:glycosyltransferase family 39 protein [Candidatus Thermoplasmatota archaeon]
FVMPYGDVTTWVPTGPGPSNHYPPAYPFYLGLWFSAFGFGLAQAKAASLVMSLAALAAVYLTTRDLYGRVPAALVGGLMGLEPHLLWVTGTGFSENMVLLFFALTMWAIVRSLKDDRYIVIAGLCAGLAYLSRSSVGYFFVIAGIGGFLWRFYYKGWALFRNLWYMGAIAVFGAIVLGWATRNVLLFGYQRTLFPPDVLYGGAAALAGLGVLGAVAVAWRRKRSDWPVAAIAGLLLLGGGALALAAFLAPAGACASCEHALGGGVGAGDVRGWQVDVPRWETSSYVRFVSTFAADRPDQWGYALWMKIPLFLGFLAWYAVPFLPETWRATKRVREEETSALWLSVALIWILAWILTAMFWVFEKSFVYWLDNHRYVVIGLLPLGWLVVREMRTDRASARIRYALLLASLFAACAGTFVSPVKFADLRAAEQMDPWLRPGDEVAIDGGTIKYAFYAYLARPETIQVYGCSPPEGGGACFRADDATYAGKSPEFVLSIKDAAVWDAERDYYGPNHTLVYQMNQTYWNGGVMRAQLYVRNDVAAERGIPLPATFEDD